MSWQFFTLSSGFLSILVAFFLARWVIRQKCDNPKMTAHSEAIQKGSQAYLRRLFQVLLYLALAIGVLIFFALGWQKAVAFWLGSLCSSIAGYLGMLVATKANAKVAWAARKGLRDAFPIGFFAGAVMGLSVVGLALVGMSLVYMVFQEPQVVLAFSFGASSLALLAKVGGGIFTKTADISADLVGKVEFNLAEDDPRNPAVIADNVGDNVGDVAGMGVDIFDSYVASVVAVMLLGFSLYPSDQRYVIYPLVLGAAGIFSSILGMIFVKPKENKNLGVSLNIGTVATALIFALLSYLVTRILGFEKVFGVWGPTTAGLLAGVILGFTSDYFTGATGMPVRQTALSGKSGTAILILNGFSYGLLSILPSIIGICLAMAGAWFLAVYFGIAGTYGVSIAAVGMLSVTGMVVSADAYGPIVDNAKSCAKAGKEDEKTVKVCDKLDAAGNTAKAVTKGFAIGAAALTVLALFAAYAETVGIRFLDLRHPETVVGLFLGAMMPPLFSAMTILSVSRNAFLMVEEIRRQFKEIPGLLEGKADPDSSLCVDIAAKGALKELVGPAAASLLTPLFVGIVFGVNALGGFLAGSIVTGLIFALFMSNAGGLWDNAKKYIEDGALGGKGSEAHKAAVIGDTVGDPFKDTAGPSINTLITVMSLCAIVFGVLIAKYSLLKL